MLSGAIRAITSSIADPTTSADFASVFEATGWCSAFGAFAPLPVTFLATFLVGFWLAAISAFFNPGRPPVLTCSPKGLTVGVKSALS